MSGESANIDRRVQAVEATIRDSMGDVAELVGADRICAFDYDTPPYRFSWDRVASAIRGNLMTSLSVLVPVYNEQHFVAASLARLEVLESSPHLEQIQVIVVDDGSKDGTPEELRAFAARRGLSWRDDAAPVDGTSLVATGRAGKTDWVFLRHACNSGKGRAIRTALAHARYAITVIHDAEPARSAACPIS
jgi:cellulose synthase/poly-beta-1,6-N-acetylglucosamine synthase-like glycosyltransferase